MYTITECSEKVHSAVKTLQKWDRQGKLVAKRRLNNRRYYTDDDVHKVLGIRPEVLSRKTIVYSRVSSAAQKSDLQNQKRALEELSMASGRQVDEWLDDVGSGLNLKRKHFIALRKRVERGAVGEMIIAHQDRLVRFG